VSSRHFPPYLSQEFARMVKTLDDIILRSNPLPVWICDRRNNEILDVNSAVISHYKFPKRFWKKKRLENILLGFVAKKSNCSQQARLFDRDGNLGSLGYEVKEVAYKGVKSLLVVAYPLESKQSTVAPSTRVKPVMSTHHFLEALTQTSILSVTDEKGIITFVNDNFLRVSGFTAEELLGKDHRIINSGHHSKMFWDDVWKTITAGSAWRGDIMNKARDGSCFWVDNHIFPFRSTSGPVREYVSIANDITERKKLEEMNSRKAEWLKIALRFASMGVAEFNPYTKRVLVSDELQELLEENGDVKEFQLDEFFERFIVKDDHELVKTAIAHGLEESTQGQHRLRTNFRIQTTSGKIKNIAALGTFTHQSNAVGLLQVTVEKMMEDDLKELTERLTLATTAAKLGIWDYNVVTDELIWDKSTFDMYGLTGRATGLVTWLNTLHPDEQDQKLRDFEIAVRTRDVYDDEFRIIRDSDQSVRNIKTLGIVKRDSNKNPLRVVGVHMDITEQKLAEEKTLRSEARYRSIVNDQVDLICRYTANGDLTFMNKSFIEVLTEKGRPGEGQNFFDLFPLESSEPKKIFLHRLFAGEKTAITTEGQSFHPKSKKWWQWNHIPLKNSSGEVYEVQAIGQDITKRRQLELQQQRLNKIVKESYNEIYLFNPDTLQFEFANESALKNLGYSLDQLIKMRLSDLFHYPNEMALQVLVKSLRTGATDRLQLTLRHRRKNGTYYDIETVIQLLENESSMVAIATDITQKLETEKKLLATIMEKEALIKEIHHRVKNNLQLISSIIYIKLNSVVEPEIKYFLNDMRQKIHSVALMHERLLQSETLDKVDIAEYLGNLICDLQSTNVRQDKNIEVASDFDRVTIDIDSAIYCALIVNELITNSIKHAFNETNHGRIVVGFKQVEKEYVLSVKDDGSTIPLHIQPEGANSFGMHLLEIFVKQLRGRIEIIRDNGTAFNINFTTAR
jgi:PAS domain S-box-containing protein